MGGSGSRHTGFSTGDLAFQPWMVEILAFCDWRDRASCLLLRRGWFEVVRPFLFRFLTRRLVEESPLILPQDWLSGGSELPSDWDWRAVFVDMMQHRRLWITASPEAAGAAPLPLPLLPPVPADSEDEEEEDNVQCIRVCVRFRPELHDYDRAMHRDEEEEEEERSDGTVVLPLHQRIEIVKKRLGLTSTSEALRELSNQLGRAAADPWSGADCRHLSRSDATDEEEDDGERRGLENARGFKASVLSVSAERGRVIMVAPCIGLRAFRFDTVMDSSTTQQRAYFCAGRRVVTDFINGVDGSVIAYGQTGSGKTFTMFGECDGGGGGIVPQALHDVFDALAERQLVHGCEVELTISYVEIYGQEVIDLLRGGRLVGQSRVAAQRYVLDGDAEVHVASIPEAMRLLQLGEGQKRRAATAMNERSSRAHALFTLSLRQQLSDSERTIHSRLIFADLGGCEHVGQSRVRGQRLREAIYINKGLFALNRCIRALRRRQPYVPFQDSILTKLLSGAFMGDSSKAVVLVTASPAAAHALQTLQALRFGERCGRIERAAGEIRVSAGALLQDAIDEIDASIAQLEEEIRRKERWVNLRSHRADADGEETILTSKLVGAETERARLESLLRRRAALLQPQ